ncbi:AAA family ATPase [Candidatus Peregrinibacteria bacterium]|nr:AAA family ATPase [Candidatus Peregrinibacteria bacterium]
MNSKKLIPTNTMAMTTQYSQQIIDILDQAKNIAVEINAPCVKAEHVFSALIRSDNETIEKILNTLKTDKKTIIQFIGTQKINLDTTKNLSEKTKNIGFDAELKKLMRNAQEEALKTKQTVVQPIHLLLAFARDTSKIVKSAFEQVKISYENIFQTISMQNVFGENTSGQNTSAQNTFGQNTSIQNVFEQNTFSQNATEAKTNDSANAAKSLTPYLDEFGIDLNEKAKKGELDPLIARFEETERIMTILARRRKNNPVLFGGPGVGKTAIVEGIASMIVSGKAPENLKEKRIIELSIYSVIAGASKRGEFEQRLKNIIEEVKNSQGKIILFIDEIHTLVSEEDTDEAANILKPVLARGEIQCIGATTEAEYRKYFEKDAAFERRFQPIFISEPTLEECFLILKGLKTHYEQFHRISIPDELLEKAVMLSNRYISNRLLPDKAIDLLDEACSSLNIPEYSIPGEIRGQKEMTQYIQKQIIKAETEQNIPLLNKLKQQLKKIDEKIHILEKEYQENIKKMSFEKTQKTAQIFKNRLDSTSENTLASASENRLASASENTNTLTSFALEQVISKATGIPLTHIREMENERLLAIETILKQNIVGQDEAVKAVSEAILRNRAGLKKISRPIGSFIFMGPTGVGKTELAKRLAEYLFGTKTAAIRFDMSEFMEKHAGARLIGAPPGYIGFEEGGELTEKVRTRPYSVILFDEIEKAHPEIFNLLLQILDEGQLTDAKGQKVNFKNTIIICTTNLGGHTIDFAKFESIAPNEQKSALIKELQKLMNPELINRFDDIILFKFLKKEEIKKIVNLLLLETLEALQEKNISLSLSDSAHDKLAEIGFDPVFGARPLRSAIQKEIDNPLSKMILTREIIEGDQLNCQFNGEKFIFRKMN